MRPLPFLPLQLPLRKNAKYKPRYELFVIRSDWNWTHFLGVGRDHYLLVIAVAGRHRANWGGAKMGLPGGQGSLV